MRISILGYSASGKSTLAKWLRQRLNLPVLHLDRVQFEAGCKERDRRESLAIVADFLDQREWIIDGNYSSFYLSERLETADRIIFLDFPRLVCLQRAFQRYFEYRSNVREDMADGCIEKMDLEFVWWILYQGRTHGKQAMFRKIREQYADKMLVLRNQKELDAFFENFSATMFTA